MNTYNYNDEEFKKSKIYQDFIKDNPSKGYLKIRAYAANQAIPINDLKIIVSKNVSSNRIIFFEGITNSSGIIERITLPTPKLDPNNLDAPIPTTYDIEAISKNDNIINKYKVNMYEDIYVVQNINIIPTLNVMAGDN